MGNEETIQCSHCGGAVRSAAKICKHCKRAIDAVAESAPRAPEAPPVTGGAEVARDLRALLVSRGVLSPAAFDALAAARPGADAAVVLGHLCAAGHVTAIQVESLREAFRERQLARLTALLDGAVARTLLGASHAHAARSGFEAVVFQQTPAQYLTVAQYLTAAQVQVLGGGVPQASAARARETWLRLRNDPELSRPVLAGPVAMAAIVALLVFLVNSRTDVGDGWFLLLFAPLAVVLFLVWQRSTALDRLKWVGATVATGAATLLLLTLGVRTFGTPPPIELEPHCTMAGNGSGECVFTNLYARRASGCGQITASCTPRNGTPESRESESICSGVVSPGMTRRMSFTVAEFDRVRNRAVPWSGDWRTYCRFVWTPQ